MRNFEEDLVATLKQKIISEVKNVTLVQNTQAHRKTIPPEFIEQAWQAVDWKKVMDEVKTNMETRICNSIVASMETEIKTDIKKLLSVSGVREKLRMEVYPHLMKVINGN